MISAADFPTMRFTRDEVAAMPDMHQGFLSPEGYSRGHDDYGRLVIGYRPIYSPYCTRVVRPIIMIKAKTRKVSFHRDTWVALREAPPSAVYRL